MVQCDIKNCGSWFHLKCILFSKDSRRMLVFPAKGMKGAEFVCPNCLDSVARIDIGSTIERLKKRLSSEELTRINSSELMGSSAQNADKQHNLLQAEGINLEEPSAPAFELAREEIYHGYDEGGVDDLVSNLHQSILDYNIEVCQAIDRSSTQNQTCIRKPLAAWELNCGCDGTIEARPWYYVEDPVRKQCNAHAPITAALRSILRTPDNKPLEIDLELRSLNFSQVHTGFISWFVHDILNDELRLYNLPNMRPLRAMMAAVNHFGEARKLNLSLPLLHI